MADNYVKGSFAFTCTQGELELLSEAFNATSDLLIDSEAGDPTPALLAVLPPKDPAAPWSGLCDLFGDPDFPDLGANIHSEVNRDTPGTCTVHIYGTETFQPDPIAHLIHRCCQATLKQGPIGFEWAETCSKPRAGEFGGGWCAIFPDRIEFENTRQALSAALDEGGKA